MSGKGATQGKKEREKGKGKGKKGRHAKERAEREAAAPEDPLAAAVGPDVKARQQQELLNVTKDMCRDAISIYEAKLKDKHELLYQLEEEIRSLTWHVSDMSSEQRQGSSPKGGDGAPDTIELRPPLELDEVETVEAAKQGYSKLLLYYLEHQSVLDAIVHHKQAQVQALLEQLEALGWSPPSPPPSVAEAEAEVATEAPAKKRGRSKSKLPLFRSKREERREKEERKEERREGREAGASSPQLTSPTRASNAQVRLMSNRDIVSQQQQQRSGGQSMVTPDHFTVLRVIGEGAFGKVFLVTKKKTGERMAMKVMEKRSILQDGDDSLRHVIHELEFMRDMSHHPFIVSLYHSYQTETDVNIVMEWVGGGSLFELLVNREDPFAEDEARFFAAQVLLAVQALHSNDIVYRDLKLENILLDGDGYIRLSDFGLSARAKHGDRIHSFSGTATYLAPEIIEDTGEKGHDKSVDMWCFGVMLFIMLTQEPPFYAEHYPDLFNLIRSTEIPYNFYSYLSPRAVSILKGLLTKDPKRRLGCGPRGLAEVQDHPFFSGISWKNLLAKKTAAPFKPNIYYGKPLEEMEAEAEEEGKDGAQSAPIDVFKGFSFVWDPSAAQDVLTESIEVVGSGRSGKGGIYKRKNHIVMNFFVWIKEVQGLSGGEEGTLLRVRWKHECKKQLTSVGPDANVVQDQTEAKACANRSVVYEGGMDNACIPFDYLMVQDRNTKAFEPRPLQLTLVAAPPAGAKAKKKAKERILGTLVLDMADYGFHKLQQSQILTMDGSGATVTIQIVCTWKSYNGDPVDNYEKASLRMADRASRML